ncbi:protein obstructor-E-like [Antedon mediterranea]|uniref:protein obstructor-E-like n=1 Tax=Antedon mediterranea TaxID=105859 RepID=UPI003AF8243F
MVIKGAVTLVSYKLISLILLISDIQLTSKMLLLKNSLFLLFVVIGVAHVRAFPQTQKLGDLLCVNKPDGKHPYPDSRKKYLVCENGYSDVRICRNGLAFNDCAQDCREPDVTLSCFCIGKLDGRYTDPSNCHRYYSCSNEATSHDYCAPELTYNSSTGTCDELPKTGPPTCYNGVAPFWLGG